MDDEVIKIAAQPINWINDDFRDLGADITLEQCLGEMREAGYAGTELGHRYPDDATELKALLDRFGLQLASAWHSTYLARDAYDVEEKRFDAHMRKLQHCGAGVVIVCECTHAIHGDGTKPLRFRSGRDLLDEAQWRRVYEGLDRLSAYAAQYGMRVAFHPHMGTVVQDGDDVDALMANTKTMCLLLDTGHLAFAGADPFAIAQRHVKRIAHVHAKNVRFDVVERAKREGWTFEQSVRAGAFTVPGDGGIDYAPIFELLKSNGYDGWLVVEAEQDPKKANPLEYAKKGREYLRRLIA